MFLNEILSAEPLVLALLAVVAVAYGVAAFGLLVAFVGVAAVADGGSGRLGYAMLRGARRPSARRWAAAFAVCGAAASLATVDVEAVVMATWVVLAPGLELGEAIAGNEQGAALAIAGVASALYWVLATTGLPLVLRALRGAAHDVLGRRRIDRHA